MKQSRKEMGFAMVLPVIHVTTRSENLKETNRPRKMAQREITSWRKPFLSPLYANQQAGMRTMMSIQFMINFFKALYKRLGEDEVVEHGVVGGKHIAAVAGPFQAALVDEGDGFADGYY